MIRHCTLLDDQTLQATFDDQTLQELGGHTQWAIRRQLPGWPLINTRVFVRHPVFFVRHQSFSSVTLFFVVRHPGVFVRHPSFSSVTPFFFVRHSVFSSVTHCFSSVTPLFRPSPWFFVGHWRLQDDQTGMLLDDLILQATFDDQTLH